MKMDKSIAMVEKIMRSFAESTGFSECAGTPRRYLWTDAFAVCNFLELYRQKGDPQYLELARRLVDQVHHVLGRYSDDDSRAGWISGLDDAEGEKHPTRGGLRIGKKLPERRQDEPYDERLEWERDGQYYHYLTKWMLALNRLSRESGETLYNRWAVELAKAAHAAFTYLPPYGSRPMMYWKMSIDLSRPLVPSMGHHDPLDGLLAFLELQQEISAAAESEQGNLEAEIRDLTVMCAGRDWTTDDPLGLGGILADALRAARLLADGLLEPDNLFEDLLDAAADGLSVFSDSSTLRYPAEYRLAFRELGLSIGLHAAERIEGISQDRPEIFGQKGRFAVRLREILHHRALGDMIEIFWSKDENQQAASWVEHADINMVMLATSMAPDGFFGRE
jgi:hypothetical protein